MNKKMVLMFSFMKDYKFSAAIYILPDLESAHEVLDRVADVFFIPVVKWTDFQGAIGAIHWNIAEAIMWDAVSDEVVENAIETVALWREPVDITKRGRFVSNECDK